MRDEMANLAWAIERTIESPIEQAIRRDALVAASAGTPPTAATPGDPNAPPRYLLASTVPPNWIPLLPVQLADPASGRVVSRLRRGAVLQPDGSAKIHPRARAGAQRCAAAAAVRRRGAARRRARDGAAAPGALDRRLDARLDRVPAQRRTRRRFERAALRPGDRADQWELSDGYVGRRAERGRTAAARARIDLAGERAAALVRSQARHVMDRGCQCCRQTRSGSARSYAAAAPGCRSPNRPNSTRWLASRQSQRAVNCSAQSIWRTSPIVR